MTNAELANSADIVFLALCTWREARNQSMAAQIAVACTVLNRVQRPSWWGKTVCEVLFKRWQYSSLTAPSDPQLTTWPSALDPSWPMALRVADGVLSGSLTTKMIGADSYHDLSIAPPKWATDEIFVGQIGRLRFYNVDRDTERESIGSVTTEWPD